MNSRFLKSTVFCMVLVMLMAFCTGCGQTHEKSEPSQTTVQPTVETTEATQPSQTPAEKAMAMYEELLKTYPTIVDDNSEDLNDLSFGYEDNLAKFGMHYDVFGVIDLNQDGVPELVASTIVNTAWIPISVFEYDEAGNRLCLLKDPLDPESHATFEQMFTAGGGYSLYICRNGHLHDNWGGDTPLGFQEENHAYVLNEEGLAAVDCAISNYTGNASDIAVYFRDILRINDEETRNSVFGT